jgi:hypothetical protein
MLKLIEELQDKYWIDESNFGTVRMGDAVGIAAFIEFIRFQFNKPQFQIYLPKGHLAEGLVPFLGDYFMPVYDKSLMKQLPYKGNIWGWYDYIYKYYDITPQLRVNSMLKKQICINPLFDAPYSKDRNWKPELAQKLVKWALELENFDVVVIGSPTVNMPDFPDSERIRVVQGTVADSVYEILHSSIYIGGETGLTHFAFNTPVAPAYSVCLRGERVEEYTASLTEKDKGKIFNFLSVPEGQDYAFEVSTLPRGARNKQTALFTLQEGDFTDFTSLIAFLLTIPKPITEFSDDPTEYVLPQGGLILELGNSKTLDLAVLAHKHNARLMSVSNEYSKKLRKIDELKKYNLYTDRIQLICEDEEWFKKNWIETGRRWDILVEG